MKGVEGCFFYMVLAAYCREVAKCKDGEKTGLSASTVAYDDQLSVRSTSDVSIGRSDMLLRRVFHMLTFG